MSLITPISGLVKQLMDHPNLAKYLAARFFSIGGYQMLSVIIGWHIYEMTGDPWDLGLVGLVQFLPRLLFMFAAGSMADKFSRKSISVFTQFAQTLIVLVLLGMIILDFFHIYLVFFLLFLLGVIKTFEFPAIQSLLPNLVSLKNFPRALALSASAVQFTIILSPTIGGLLYAWSVLSSLIAVILFHALAALAVLGLIVHNRRDKSVISEDGVLSGIRFIRSQPVVLGAVTLDLFAVLLGGAVALMPAVAKDILHVGPWGLGFLRAAPSVGAVLVSMYLAKYPLRQRVGQYMFLSIAIFGLMTIIFGLSTNFLISMATLVLLGGSDMVNVVIRSTLIQLETPDSLRGRVSSVNALFIGASNQLGEFESGATAALFGLVPAIVIGGIGTLFMVIAGYYFFPQLYHRDNLFTENQSKEDSILEEINSKTIKSNSP